MKFLRRYWKLLLALILMAVAAVLYFNVYKTEKTAYESETRQLKTIISAQEAKITENMRYIDVQEDLEAAKAALEESRLALYKKFPVEMKEEDQIMYVLYLESLFGTEISFEFNEAQPLAVLSDGSTLKGLLLTVNYRTTYEGFQDMIDYLATDSRIASVYEATIDYYAARDVAIGTVTLLIYTLDTDALEYTPPDIATPEVGKDNIFD